MAAYDSSMTATGRIKDDHTRIFRLVASVEASLGARQSPEEWINSVTRQLMDLGELLAPHFRFERDSAMYDEEAARAAHLIPELRRLEGEHQAFLNEIGAILALARSAMDPDGELVQRLSARTAALFAAMRAHESAENDLLIRSFQEDLGAGD